MVLVVVVSDNGGSERDSSSGSDGNDGGDGGGEGGSDCTSGSMLQKAAAATATTL